MNPKVDQYMERQVKWQAESERLRAILLGFALVEELKWGHPCYALDGKNVVLIGGFKEYCVLLFFKGALMVDAKKLLVAPGKTQAGRQMRFASLDEVVAKERTIKAYVKDAIEIEKKGLKVALKEHAEYEVPEELQKRLDKSARLKKAFEALTPGRQRGYMFYVASAKQAATREARVEKCVERILAGKGLDD